MAELVVFSSLFPSAVRPGAGLFIRERMFRVARHRALVVVSPQPWFPGQGLIRRFRPGYRPEAPAMEIQQGIRVYHPRFLALPGVLRRLDGWSMALATVGLMRRLRSEGARLIDAHFAYPDGEAATRLGRWLGLPVTITLRGTEVPHSKNPVLRPRLVRTLAAATHIFSVSDSLRRLAIELGVSPDKTEVVGNGVDTGVFHPVGREAARQTLGLPASAKVLISVGGLVERKGMHRVIDCLPGLLKSHPDLHYLVVGGASPEGDMRAELDAQATRLGVAARVHFLGTLAPDELKGPLSSADVFVLSTRNEGWANVFLEAMACGLPVISTDVGGNAEVVCRPELGTLVPFGDAEALARALDRALSVEWNRAAILAYAQDNQWDRRVAQLLRAFTPLLGEPLPGTPETVRS
ncbi:MAG: glycosyl transferase family 1 [Hydrogenophilales bacterium 16-64-46]|nr:MAG: glycosyl transferase family 1 [Hydrogenophilales bacterium 12-64-13]OYZ07226.1 MAG: glycosyl transferase family 1 [Hydrogenophilales bacterium 16-64-46]OZA37307.1 MAG: glycosyl transferase family 1 [Hydrogenophilales bacterium 17-64-34]HQS98942.1 glycosyltransferase [Thiobacillus sp.]